MTPVWSTRVPSRKAMRRAKSQSECWPLRPGISAGLSGPRVTPTWIRVPAVVVTHSFGRRAQRQTW